MEHHLDTLAGATATMSRDATPVVLVTDRHVHAGAEEPFHVHVRADESILVLDGTVVVTVDGTRSVLIAGDAISVPAGSIHYVVPVRGCAGVMVAYRPAEPVLPAGLPEDAWPLVDGLGTLLLGPDRSHSRPQARTTTSADHGA